MFGGLEPDEYRELQDYYKSFGGIEPLSVNKNITTEDVLRATGPLSQPVGPGLTSTVAQFNQFLGSILGAKSQRVADEKEAVEAQNLQVRTAVDEVLNKEKPERRIIEGADGFQYYEDTKERVLPNVVKPGDPQTIKLTGGVEMTKEDFDALSQDQKNILLGLDENKGQVFNQLIETDDGPRVLFTEDGELKVKAFENLGPLLDEDADKTLTGKAYLISRQAELKFKQQQGTLTDEELFELEGITKELAKKPFETTEEKEWGETKNELVVGGPDARELLFKVQNAVNIINQEEFRSGVLTPGATFLQQVLSPFGIDLKFLTDFVGLELLNPEADSATIRALGNQFGISLSEGLSGNISNLELLTLLQSTINLGSPKDFNKNFGDGLLYLAKKGLYQTQAAAESNTAAEWAEKMNEYVRKNPPPLAMQDFYKYNQLGDLNINLKLTLPDKEN